MSAGSICTRVVVTAAPAENVLAVARRMEERNVGTVVVVGPDLVPLAIVTDRDIVLRCVARELDPGETPVSLVMTAGVRTVAESTPIEDALEEMARAGARRLVVTGADGRLAGILALDDIVEVLATEAVRLARLLRKESPRLATRP